MLKVGITKLVIYTLNRLQLLMQKKEEKILKVA